MIMYCMIMYCTIEALCLLTDACHIEWCDVVFVSSGTDTQVGAISVYTGTQTTATHTE